MLIAYSVSSQTVTDSVCFDFETAKRIAIDLNELDDYRAKEPFQLADISDLKKINHIKDSIIENLKLQAKLQNEIIEINRTRNKITKGEKKWLKWVFLAGGLTGGYLLAK